VMVNATNKIGQSQTAEGKREIGKCRNENG